MVGRREFAMLGLAGVAGVVSQLVPEASNIANGQGVHRPPTPMTGVITIKGGQGLPKAGAGDQVQWTCAKAGPGEDKDQIYLQFALPKRIVFAAWRGPDSPANPTLNWIMAGMHFAPNNLDQYQTIILAQFKGGDELTSWLNHGTDDIHIHYNWYPPA
jgi:hypothetical protein